MSLQAQNTVIKYRYTIDNQDDRKGLDLLVEKLFDLQPKASGSSSIKTPKSNGPIFSKYGRNRHKIPPKRYDPTGWIERDKGKHLAKSIKTKQVQEPPKQSLPDDSFSKYGVKLPRFEEVLASIKKFEKEVQHVDSLLDTIEPIPAPVSLNLVEHVSKEVVLDCKHLSDLDIDNVCHANRQYIYDICNGIKYCKRQQLFEFNPNNKALRYNTSMITFTYSQKQQLLAFLSENFSDNQYSSKIDDYFFKVLLPELCLKIFMDSHNMDPNEAVAYLDRRPID